jgi:zinc and cadmium transporter
MSVLSLLIIYSALIVTVSLLGGWLPTRVKLTHTGTQVMMSFVAGLMLGIAFYHLLPHAAYTMREVGGVDRAVWWLVIGLLFMFVLLRAFHFHQHGPVINDECDHHGDQQHIHTLDQQLPVAKGISWFGVALGLGLHTLIDGVALGAAMQSNVIHNAPLGLIGVGVFAAIILHKPLDSMSITSLMLAGGWSEKAVTRANVIFSVLCPMGALAFFVGVDSFTFNKDVVVGVVMAFSAGVFVCISLSDLLPEIQFHSHDRAKLTVALLSGIALSYAIGLLEPEMHDHSESSVEAVEQHTDHPIEH